MDKQVKGEGRFATTNTKLAAALLVMNFQLAEQPFISMVGGPTRIFFRTGIKWDQVEGGILQAEEVERRWKDCMSKRDELLPWLAWMNAALVERDNIIREVIHGGLFPPGGQFNVPTEAIPTDDLHLAATLQACGFQMLWFSDKQFYFPGGSRKTAADYLQRRTGRRAHWMRSALEQQMVLIEAIRGRRNIPIKTFPGKRPGSCAIIPQNMPTDLARRTLRELHR